MIKRTNGTRGFIGQISRKIILEKGFKYKLEEGTFKNDNLKILVSKLRNEISEVNDKNRMCKPFRHFLNKSELELFKSLFKKDYKDAFFEISSKCFIEDSLFHSLLYSRKGEVDSYSICFKFRNKEHFGKITKFILVNKKIHAFVNKYEMDREFHEKLPDLPSQYGLKKDSNFRILNELFASYYHCFDENKYILKLVPIEDIICKCLVVYSKESSFFTK